MRSFMNNIAKRTVPEVINVNLKSINLVAVREVYRSTAEAGWATASAHVAGSS